MMMTLPQGRCQGVCLGGGGKMSCYCGDYCAQQFNKSFFLFRRRGGGGGGEERGGKQIMRGGNYPPSPPPPPPPGAATARRTKIHPVTTYRKIDNCVYVSVFMKFTFNGFVVPYTMILKPILALHIMNFSSCQNYWGGGGKTICPPIFSLGATPPSPPPPRFDASAYFCNLNYFYRFWTIANWWSSKHVKWYYIVSPKSSPDCTWLLDFKHRLNIISMPYTSASYLIIEQKRHPASPSQSPIKRMMLVKWRLHSFHEMNYECTCMSLCFR